LKPETVAQHREALLDFAERVERLPIAVAVGADLLRRQFGPLTEAARGLALDRLRSEVQDVPGLLERAIEAQGPLEQRLLEASAVCAAEGFWLPLAIKIAGLSEAEGAAARDVLVNSSLLRVLDRERQRFQLHALLREQLRRGMGVRGMGVRGTGILPVRVQEDAGGTGARRGRGILPVEEHAQDARATSITALQERHAAVVEGLFKDWETRWQECRECLAEVIPAAEFLWGKRETSREAWLSYRGYVLASRVGELDAARRIVTREEGFCAGRDDREAKDALQRSYGNQAVILKAWGRLEEALALHKKQEAICLELGNKSGLGHCYWYWGLLARAQGDRETEKQKLEAALALFSELKMPRERDAVRAQSNRLTGPPAPKAGSA
jgi:tetratricopeptide (TPR) repeat protein